MWNIYNYKDKIIFYIIMKDYIDNVYQSYSKFKPVSTPKVLVFGIVRQGNNLIENFYEQDKETGILYQEKPNWLGGETKPLSQGMADYIFENVNVPIGYDDTTYPDSYLGEEKTTSRCPNLMK